VNGLIGWLLAFGAGLLVGGVVVALVGSRGRATLKQRVLTHLGPLVDRRAALLGVQADSLTKVDVGSDGELELDGSDRFERLLQVADIVEEREHAQLGYVDTIRVSKDEVAESVLRRRDSGS
jgi:hypothetical protein